MFYAIQNSEKRCKSVFFGVSYFYLNTEIININPFSLVKIDGKRLFRKVKKKANGTQVFLESELTQIVPMAWEDFNNRTKVYELAPLAFLFQFQTGLRIGEVCAVRYEDIETPDFIHIQRILRRDTNEVVNHTKTEYGDVLEENRDYSKKFP